MWPDLHRGTLKLSLPRGAPRPPTVRVELWDDELPEADMPLAWSEVRLSGSLGGPSAGGSKRTVLMATHDGLRDVAVAFAYAVKSLGPEVPAWAAGA